jgi:hypothetical protein
MAALNVEAATVTESVATPPSATLAPKIEALTSATSDPAAASEITAENVDGDTVKSSVAVVDSRMIAANRALAKKVSATEDASAIEELNVFDPEAAKGAAAKAEPLNICYPIRQRQG